jgi:hypothetical protein
MSDPFVPINLLKLAFPMATVEAVCGITRRIVRPSLHQQRADQSEDPVLAILLVLFKI